MTIPSLAPVGPAWRLPRLLSLALQPKGPSNPPSNLKPNFVLTSGSILVHSFTGKSALSSTLRPFDFRALFVQLREATLEVSTNLPNAWREPVRAEPDHREKLAGIKRLC